jgi:N-carbamoyl-L-amino-acid hydrolase
LVDAVERSAQRLALRSMRMASGAGHDAMALAEVTPAGMVFVPSVGGRSHDPSELTPWQSCVDGANVLLGAALELAIDASASGPR